MFCRISLDFCPLSALIIIKEFEGLTPGVETGEPHPDHDFFEVIDEKKVKLSQVIPGEKAKFTYEYDFGDSWEHELLVEKVLPPESGMRYPVCLRGKRACPPRIAAEFGAITACRNPDHPEHDDMLEWLGDDFDPETFDIDEVNWDLERI
ncbi:MAG: plasmid pRiA4b ORF-3 family protein [bacterium]